MTSLQSRFRGVLLGVLAGDALGAPYEHSKAQDIVADFVKRGGLAPFDYIDPWEKKRPVKAGQPTDDSELTAALALSLADRDGFIPDDLYLRLRDFIHGNADGKRRSYLTKEAYGTGSTLRAALRAPTYLESFEAFRLGRVPAVPSNGSLMRAAPVALRYHRNWNELERIARSQSCVTHVHPMAQASCIAYCLMLNNLLCGESPQGAWEQTKVSLAMAEVRDGKQPDKILSGSLREIVAMPVTRPTEDEVWPLTGSAFLSLRIALWATLSSKDFRSGIEAAVAVGGDVDTYGAIAGGLLGAHYGEDGILQEWRNILQGADRMRSLADQLYEKAAMW